MAFFPRCAGEFSPLFQLLDDYDVHRSTRRRSNNINNKVTPVRSFAPKFDVYEVNDRYHLEGELPGVDQDNIEIEFTDPNTLVIKGRSERNYHQQQQTDDASDETSSTKSHQPTVEDDEGDYDQMSDATPAQSPAPTNPEVTQQKRPEVAYKYWMSERSIGEFHRTFTFPVRVDQDSVKASLKDGVLSLVLPKEAAPKVKKIRVE